MKVLYKNRVGPKNGVKACIACKHDSFFYTESRFECIPSCGNLDEVILDSDLRSVRTGSLTIIEKDAIGIPFEVQKNAFMDGTNVCRLCHLECNFGCTGITSKEQGCPETQTFCFPESCFLNFKIWCKNLNFAVIKNWCKNACEKMV